MKNVTLKLVILEDHDDNVLALMNFVPLLKYTNLVLYKTEKGKSGLRKHMMKRI